MFEMAALIQSLTKFEVRSVIRFLTSKGERWDILDNPPYSPNFAPSDFQLFLHLNKHHAGKNFDEDDEVQEEVMTWFKGLAADFYDSGI